MSAIYKALQQAWNRGWNDGCCRAFSYVPINVEGKSHTSIHSCYRLVVLIRIRCLQLGGLATLVAPKLAASFELANACFSPTKFSDCLSSMRHGFCNN